MTDQMLYYIPTRSMTPAHFSDALCAYANTLGAMDIAIHTHRGDYTIIEAHAIPMHTMLTDFFTDIERYQDRPYSQEFTVDGTTHILIDPTATPTRPSDQERQRTMATQTATVSQNSSTQAHPEPTPTGQVCGLYATLNDSLKRYWKPIHDVAQGADIYIEHAHCPQDLRSEGRHGIIIYVGDHRSPQTMLSNRYNSTIVGRVVKVEQGTPHDIIHRNSPTIFRTRSNGIGIAEIRPTPHGWAVILFPGTSMSYHRHNETPGCRSQQLRLYREQAYTATHIPEKLARSMAEWEFNATDYTSNIEAMVPHYAEHGYPDPKDTIRQNVDLMNIEQGRIQQMQQVLMEHPHKKSMQEHIIQHLEQHMAQTRDNYARAWQAAKTSPWVQSIRATGGANFVITMNPDKAGQAWTLNVSMDSMYKPATSMAITELNADHPLSGPINHPMLMEQFSRAYREGVIHTFLRTLTRIIAAPERMLAIG